MTAVQTRKFPTIPGYAPQTEKLIERLAQGKVGDTITPDELMQVSGRNCRSGGNGYQNLQSARRYVQDRHQLVWEWRGGLLKCIDANEIQERVETRRKHIHKQSKRGLREATIALSRNGELDDGNRTRLLATSAQLGALAEFSHGRTTNKIEEKKPTQPVDMRKLIEQME